MKALPIAIAFIGIGVAGAQDAQKPKPDQDPASAQQLWDEMMGKGSDRPLSGKQASLFGGGEGVNGIVSAMAAQPDGKVVIGGRFNEVNNMPRLNLARINADGTLDSTYLAKPEDGVDGSVFALALDANGNLVVGGSFMTAQGQPRRNLVRYLPDGSLDKKFDAATGPDGPVYAIAIQKDGKTVIGGEFSLVGGEPRRNIARFNADSTLDGPVAPANQTTGAVRSLVPLAGGEVIAGGKFTIEGLPSRNLLRVPALTQ